MSWRRPRRFEGGGGGESLIKDRKRSANSLSRDTRQASALGLEGAPPPLENCSTRHDFGSTSISLLLSPLLRAPLHALPRNSNAQLIYALNLSHHVLRHSHALSNGTCHCVADGGARVPEVFAVKGRRCQTRTFTGPDAELRNFLANLKASPSVAWCVALSTREWPPQQQSITGLGRSRVARKRGG